jgi:ADP-ribosylarginine hydrolase
MHLATAETLTDPTNQKLDLYKLMTKMTDNYSECMNDMSGRGPGIKCISSLNMLDGRPQLWNQMPYDKAGGGCGGSMRAMCIGLLYPGENNRRNLIQTAIESGRITHNHVNGFMGALVSAAFTAYALEDVPPKKWGHLLINDLIPQCLDYLKETKRDYEYIKMDMKKFESKFLQYMTERNVVDGDSEPQFPATYGVPERDAFYKKWSYNGWAGASGDDSVIIAYDAVLGAKDSWEELVLRGVLHYGDNDSTGTIACAWWGAMYGYPDAKYEKNWKGIEYESRLKKQAELLYKLQSAQS